MGLFFPLIRLERVEKTANGKNKTKLMENSVSDHNKQIIRMLLFCLNRYEDDLRNYTQTYIIEWCKQLQQ